MAFDSERIRESHDLLKHFWIVLSICSVHGCDTFLVDLQSLLNIPSFEESRAVEEVGHCHVHFHVVFKTRDIQFWKDFAEMSDYISEMGQRFFVASQSSIGASNHHFEIRPDGIPYALFILYSLSYLFVHLNCLFEFLCVEQIICFVQSIANSLLIWQKSKNIESYKA